MMGTIISMTSPIPDITLYAFLQPCFFKSDIEEGSIGVDVIYWVINGSEIDDSESAIPFLS
jgi:hypothetical protein